MAKKSSLEVELELEKINKQLLKQQSIISLKEANNLFLKAKKEVKSIENSEITEKIQEEVMKVFLKMLGLVGNYGDKWKEGKFSPTNEELDIMKKLADDSEKAADNEYIKYGKSAEVDKEAVTMIRNKMKELGEKIQAEKTRRQNPSNDNNENGGDNNNENENGSNSQNNQNNSDDTKQKITNLQNQINTLEEKLRKQPTSDSNSEDKEKLARLKAEIEALKKQKDKPQNEGSDKKDNFPYGLVIGGGIAIVILLIAVIFFWQRSKRK